MKNNIGLRAASLACGVLLAAGVVVTPVMAAPAAAPAAQVQLASTAKKTPGKWVKKGGKKYRYNGSGKLLKGYFIVDGKRYYAQKNGAVVTKKGWFKRSDGKMAYAGSKGVIKYGVITVNKKMYYVNKFGLLRNGLFKVSGKWYLTTKGTVTKGWNTYKGKRYYVHNKGYLLTGKQTIKGQTYQFSSKGVLQEDTLTVTRNGKKVSGPASEILARVVMAEVGGFRNAEVYKAQAVAAHTFLLYNYSKGTKYPSVPDASPTTLCKTAVAEVANMYLTYNDKPIFAPYTASNNGRTNPCKDFWKLDYPYLQSVPSKYDYLSDGFKATKTINVSDFRDMMDKHYGKGNYTLGSDPNKWIVTEQNSQGYVTKLNVGGRTPSPEYFYQSIVGIRSPAFTVKYNKSRDALMFTTEGYGHGVGLSQWGAYFYATKDGYNYNQILAHYYPGAQLVK